MKIVVDAFGGDNAPLEIVEGAVQAIQKNKDLEIILCGKTDKIKEILNGRDERIEIVDAQEIVENSDHPTEAIRKKRDSSLVRAYDVLKEREDVVGLVSAGSTGAILAGAIMKIGRIKGISRPALAPILPTKLDNDVLMVDSGANVDCKPINLLHFALMGSAYYSIIYNKENPRVALLSNGSEEGKGNELVKETYPLLHNAPINFIGNKEGGDYMSGEVDVMVADGFAGNALLKGSEGAVNAVLSVLKKSIKSHFSSKIGYMFMKKTFNELKQRIDVQGRHAGSPLLGCKKLVVKNHGSCNRINICASIEQTIKLHEKHLIAEIENSLVKLNLAEGE
ncbi:MAG: phosphate acyltransferase PlsX [Clostridiales bacterium]|nr:phosphate acyltransferase PlsX [Clostridiales bacterium]